MSRRREARLFYLFIAPWIIGFLLFTGYPIVMSLYLSFTQYDIVHEPVWVGLKNFADAFADKFFFRSVEATAKYTVLSVPMNLTLAMLLALLLNAKIPAKAFFRTAFYLPCMISGVALSLLWVWIFNPQVGILNYAIVLLGGSPQPWLQSSSQAIPSLLIMNCWTVGTTVVIFLAGLQGVPTVYYEAAVLDGCGPVRKFFSITLPMLSPVLTFQLITGLINALQAFSQAFVMTQGGPNYATYFYVFYLFQKGFKSFEMGYASAMSWMFIVVVTALTVLIFKFTDAYSYTEERGG